MSPEKKESISHGIVALFMAAGLMLPILGMLELMQWALPCCSILLVVIAAFTVAGMLKKPIRLILYGVLGASALIFLMTLLANGSLVETFRAMVMQVSGQSAALPLYAREIALTAAVLVAFASWGLTCRAMGCYPAIALVLLSALMLWLSSHEDLLWGMLPAVASVIALAVMTTHDDLPLKRILPVTVAAVLLAFFLTPAGGVTISPLKEAADSLRQRIFDYFFFTEQRDVFSLASEGYYPQGQNQLGGTAEPTDHPVMIVSTPKKVYLRGITKNEYTGRTWLNTTGGRRYQWQSSRWASQRTTLFDMDLPDGVLGSSGSLMEEQTITVQLLSENASSLFVPQRVRSLSPGGALVPYFNNASEIFATHDLQAGDTYSVSAPLFVAGDAGLGTLIDACALTDDPNYANILTEYTKLPDHLQQMVYDLARQIISGSDTPYEQAFAIQNYLSRNFRYSLTVEDQPSNLDFVTNFLMNTKKGYCTYFASAMTVLCRMVGLPARYVEGYLATPDENGLAYVTGLQGHAWTEVYFEGFGWLTFDATPAQNNLVTPPSFTSENDSNDATEPTPTPEPEEDQSTEDDATPPPEDVENQSDQDDEPTPPPENEDPSVDQDPPSPPSLWWLWLLLVLALVGGAAYRFLSVQPERMTAKAADPGQKFDLWIQAIRDILDVQKLPIRTGESPMAYTRRLDDAHLLPAKLAPVGVLMANVYYGKIIPNEGEIEQVRTSWQILFNGLTLPKKVQFQLKRFVRLEGKTKKQKKAKQ